MLSTLLLAAQLAVITAAPTYIGRENQLKVPVPRIEGDVTVDGALDEPVWRQAAVLTGFSEFSPHDGIPAARSIGKVQLAASQAGCGLLLREVQLPVSDVAN